MTQKYGIARSAQAGYAVTPYYTGNHRPTALSIAVGPGVSAGRVLNDTSILDLAPTILKFFNITVPDYMTGKALNALALHGC
jgi:predicted AlkP superfamily phosphohydrolase/phosphomutase